MTASLDFSPVAPNSSLDSAGQLLGSITTQLTAQLRAITPPERGRGTGGAEHRPTLVAVAHGSRHPAAVGAVRELVAAVRKQSPGLDVRLGHIELNEPLLADTLAELSGEVVLVPLLFGRGYHVRHDLPEALAAAAPQVHGAVAAPLGPHPLLAAALHARLVEAGWQRSSGDGVVLAAAGSRAPESAADTRGTAALLSERLGGVRVVEAYASGPGPRVEDALRRLRGEGVRNIAVASCFAAPGLFADQVRAAAPGLVSAPLGAHPALARLVLARYHLAVATASRAAA
ncbi:sirohydrochlorin chelatase [Streptomyces sp. A7024]|uniref:Sirohydrochlorin chelatase n=1 Tax=Streptomyces coryli TaxID=1128680 RepID=A0A6G4UA16_9ACTN|nr:sirohydrochlorin chelatase [Streptomyces coryli]NGN69069.1 sirohydrochlorin chelatase [Streptomyces coryli]